MFLATSVGVLSIYALLAVIIPLLINGLKKLELIPAKWLTILPAVLAFVGVLFTQLATGVGWVVAITTALSVDTLAVGGTAAMLRQIKVKGPLSSD